MDKLQQKLKSIVTNWDKIYLRYKKDGKWGSYSLSEIDDDSYVAKNVIDWINPYIKKNDR